MILKMHLFPDLMYFKRPAAVGICIRQSTKNGSQLHTRDNWPIHTRRIVHQLLLFCCLLCAIIVALLQQVKTQLIPILLHTAESRPHFAGRLSK